MYGAQYFSFQAIAPCTELVASAARLATQSCHVHLGRCQKSALLTAAAGWDKHNCELGTAEANNTK